MWVSPAHLPPGKMSFVCKERTMNTQLISNFRHISTRMPAVLLVLCLALLVTACASPTRASRPASQTGATDHPPVILRVEERQKTTDGKLTYYKDVYYSDAAG